MSISNKEQFLNLLFQSFEENNFVHLSLINKRNKLGELQKILVKPILIKGQPKLSIVSRLPTQDITKNHSLEEAISNISQHLEEHFIQGELQTTEYIHHFNYPKSGKSKLKSILQKKSQPISWDHDHKKNRLVSADKAFLFHLGIANKEGKIKSAKQAKFRQINRFVELLNPSLQSLLKNDSLDIVDFGSGKAYLSFALYAYLEPLNKNVQLTGVELRKNLVDKCNKIATDLEYEKLRFIHSSIEEYQNRNLDVLIALHACDTATDDAIAAGIKNNAKLIVCSPCCHKALRKQLKSSNEFSQITQFGILQERQAEIITDTIRALILQAHGYETKVIEFISSEHTSKNLMIIAKKKDNVGRKLDESKLKELKSLKKSFGLSEYYLETTLK